MSFSWLSPVQRRFTWSRKIWHLSGGKPNGRVRMAAAARRNRGSTPEHDKTFIRCPNRRCRRLHPIDGRSTLHSILAKSCRCGVSLYDPRRPRSDSPRPGLVLDQGSGTELFEKIGEGAMGIVYCGRSNYERVAIKTSKSAFEDPRFAKEFLLASLAFRSLRKEHGSPAIPQPLVLCVDPFPYYTMQLIEGNCHEINDHSLFDTSVVDSPARLREQLQLLLPLAHALAAMHKRGLIHCDLKPANILVRDSDGESQAFLIDFGIANHRSELNAMTQLGQYFYTPRYAPPEQREPTRSRQNPATDVFSFGCICFELLTGCHPFGVLDSGKQRTLSSAAYEELLLRRIVDPIAEPTLARTLRPDLPAALEALLAEATSRDALDRPSSAELRDRLSRQIRQL